ncbi:glyoxylate/hydroxypyruvate reductase A [Variovorax sp. YR750]|uniref:2-hydroxyacid dehydrogenase n=1 Tax=Variovorax sp. YR750 TaxID=1884384 RepID=UPI0008D5E3ED|nr:glyoxylate/hydroxypyruvate reductase A [Variovorax sp. YR750]SEL04808.1 glyoxylate/hydroxypyruvate reductase A [Variovorax sp. YR750]
MNCTDVAAAEAEVVVCWNQPHGIWDQLPAVRMAHSIGVGVDHVLADPTFPDVPVCKVIDDAQVQRMAEYVLWCTLYYHRGFDLTARRQREKVWQRPPNRRADQVVVGVMGLGQIGAQIAAALQRQGYDVRGWSRSGKPIEGVRVYGGEAGQDDFLRELDLLVCMLPLTRDTTGILDSKLFARLKPGTRLIQCGRGPQLNEPDLVAALNCGQLGGAVVDVFHDEPLPQDNPLWEHPGVLVTPHMAAVMPLADVVEQIAENCERLLSGEPLLRVVERAAAY